MRGSLAVSLVGAALALAGCGKDEEDPYTSAASVDYDGDGYIDGDCDEQDASVNPGASECYYDGVDNDCDTATPDEVPDSEAPVIVAFEMADGGLHDFGEGEVPSLQATAEVTDDLDQASVTGLLWFDSSPDGSVDTSGEATELTLDISGGCLSGSLDASLSFYLSLGGAILYDTTYDFAFAVTDAAGNTSDPVVVTATSPPE